MSHQAVEHVLRHSPSRLAARLVEIALASHAHADGTGSWPSARTIAREANLSERAVREALRSLRADGLIVVTGESAGRTRTYSVAHAVYDPPEGADGAGVQTVQGADGAGSRVQTARGEGADGAGSRVQTAQGEGADGAPKPSVEPSVEPSEEAAAAPSIPDRLIDELLEHLEPLGRINRTEIAELLNQYPHHDHHKAVREVLAWAKRDQLNSPLGAYRHVLEQQQPQPAPTPALEPVKPATLAAWPDVQERLRALVPDAYDLYLADITPVGHDGDTVVLEAPPELLVYLRERFRRALENALGGTPYRITARREVVTA